jgi:hypothetical protein
MKYFSYDPNGDGFSLHNTADDAKKAAENALREEEINAGDEGWNEDVYRICWGEITEVAVASNRRPSDNKQYSEYVDYNLVKA